MEFIATYLDELARSADRGSLLAGFAWDDADADPVRYLTGSVIRLRVVDFVARNTWHASLEEYDTVQTSADRRDAPDAWTAREARVRALTVRLRWSEGDAMTALLTVAAVQTWPSHDQNWTERKAARSAAVTSAATGESTIEAAVESGRAAIAVRLRAIALELKDHPNMAGATVRRKEARASKLLVQLLIAPIAAAELAEVLSLSSKAAAEQRLSRYRNARGSLLQIWSDGQEVRVV
jgi:hypothetical protein